MSQINLKRNIAFTTGSQVITMLASFVTNWFLARYLGPELRGQYVYLFTVNSVAWMLLDLGVSKSLMFSLQHDKADPRALYSYVIVYFVTSLFLALGVFYFAGDLLLGRQGYRYPQLILMALAVYIVCFQMFSRQKFLFMGINRIHDYFTLNTLPTLTFMVFLLPLFWLFGVKSRMQNSFLLNVALILCIVLIYHFRLLRTLNFRFIWDRLLVVRLYSLGFRAFLSEYLVILMTRLDIIILKALGGFTQLGVYSLAINFLDMINIMAGMIGVVLLNKFSALQNDRESLQILRKVFLVMLIFDFVCIAGMAAIGLPVIRLLYGVQYQEAWYAFMLLIPAIIGLTLGGLFNTFLWSKGFPAFSFIAPAIATGIKVILAKLFIPQFGLYGAAVSSSLVYPLWLLLMLIWYFGKHKDQKPSQLLLRKEDFWQLKKTVEESFAQLRGRLGR
ncbi:MAG TPA: oligosaccharide flippase family protein [Candidatus Cloacimonas sp.]|nr:oligosaccharide flippase family protein [Candidatus Cloacimonas sp.]